ncbi:MAG: hypothetical protein AMXMBFR84_14960 [Candidatus Hydrogenedentota bacterium]
MKNSLWKAFVFTCFALGANAQAPESESRKAEYVHQVTRGAGLMPWQTSGTSEMETAFRTSAESRKDGLLAARSTIQRPALIDAEAFARAKANIEEWDWAQSWLQSQIGLADYVAAQPVSWIDAMIPELSPAHGYGFTCPVCVGDKSQEAVGSGLAGWSYENPEVLTCRACGQVYPDPAFPETAVLKMPRMDQEITYYLNPAEQANPDDRSGKLAWHWVNYPIHVSFTGLVREKKLDFMRTAARATALAHAFTGKPEYAEATRAILTRFAHCYRNWLYRDYWDTYADCDPLYAAWHDRALPLEWKRHLSESAFAEDTLEKASMLQTYWGAGRVHPSTDAISGLDEFALAYDLTIDAAAPDGEPIWDDTSRAKVERDLFLEYLFGAEPYIGGPGKAENKNNKSPRIYNAMAAVAKVLGLPAYADVALKGYEVVRDQSFLYDGVSSESPSYTDMYLAQLLIVPETLHGFVWPDGYAGRSGTVDYYSSDELLRRMYRGVLWSLQPDGTYLPLSDSHVHDPPSQHIALMGLKRYPEFYAGVLPSLYKRSGGEYALFNLSREELLSDTGFNPPETFFPAWQTAVLRHGLGTEGSVLSLVLNPSGGHRHRDNLALFYAGQGDTAVGDHGYVGDMPINNWIRSTYSHNLVIVDDAEQEFGNRDPEFGFMATSPLASVVEGTSNAYPQCAEYRRRVVLVKLPQGGTFAIDLFAVAGGNKHAFRTYSEIAASDSTNGRITFDGVAMPDEPPLPEVGASLADADIFGLRDVRSAVPTRSPWHATWRDDRRAYRLWMATSLERVEASNGPGQRSLEETGRRVRYVDSVREGAALRSAYAAVHEPSDQAGGFAIETVDLLDVTAAGDKALALRITSKAGDYLVLNDFQNAVSVDGIRFAGAFALIRGQSGQWKDWLTVGATHFAEGEASVTREAGIIAGSPKSQAPEAIVAESVVPVGWIDSDEGVRSYLRVKAETGWTGFPVHSVDGSEIHIDDYPVPAISNYELPAVDYTSRP